MQFPQQHADWDIKPDGQKWEENLRVLAKMCEKEFKDGFFGQCTQFPIKWYLSWKVIKYKLSSILN